MSKLSIVKQFQNCPKLSKKFQILKIVRNCQKCQNCKEIQYCKKLSSIFNDYQNCQKLSENVSNVMFQPIAGHKFQAMDCTSLFQNQKVTQWVSVSVTQWQGHLLSWSGQLKQFKRLNIATDETCIFQTCISQVYFASVFSQVYFPSVFRKCIFQSGPGLQCIFI